MSRRPLALLTASAAAAFTVLALCVPAQAAEPAGQGIDLPTVTVTGNTLAWSGTYSCDGGLLQTLTVQATDDAGNTATETIPQLCLVAQAGTPINGTLATGLLGSGPNWSQHVTITATLADPLGNTLAQAEVTYDSGAVGDITVDDATPDSSGNLRISGTYSTGKAACDAGWMTSSYNYVPSAGNTPQPTNYPYRSNVQTIPTSATTGKWSTTIPAPSNSDGKQFLPGVKNQGQCGSYYSSDAFLSRGA
ncbi:hypothetical protein [Kitasatospora sp. LaBMicrA B282]|uniref:hypothetical protein n=1 Tax=Kitasatospora sp. LaBMicrA B282 TaxID=3420949 RepID=UPI003D0B72CA